MNELIAWKDSAYRKPLIMKGVRQVGKTWLLKEFGRRFYQNTAYFNFDENPEYRDFFATTKDVRRIIPNLAMAGGQEIQPGRTLLIFDEIQDCPEVLNALKYFHENAPEYHVACALSPRYCPRKAVLVPRWEGRFPESLSDDVSGVFDGNRQCASRRVS